MQTIPWPLCRLDTEYRRTLRVGHAALDAEVGGQIGRAHVAERGAVAVVGAAAAAHVAGVGVRGEEEARARQPGRAVRLAVARAILGDRAIAGELDTRAGDALAAVDLVGIFGRAIGGRDTARAAPAMRRATVTSWLCAM